MSPAWPRRLQVGLFVLALVVAESAAVLVALGPGVGQPLHPVDPIVLLALLVVMALCDAGAVWLTFYVHVERRA